MPISCAHSVENDWLVGWLIDWLIALNLWPSDIMISLRRGSLSTLIQVMVCCLTAQNHNLNEYCFIAKYTHTMHFIGIYSKSKYFIKKGIWKRMQSGGNFVQGQCNLNEYCFIAKYTHTMYFIGIYSKSKYFIKKGIWKRMQSGGNFVQGQCVNVVIDSEDPNTCTNPHSWIQSLNHKIIHGRKRAISIDEA